MSATIAHRRRIAFSSGNGPGIGGSDIYMGKLIDGLDLRVWEPFLIVRDDYPAARVVKDTSKVVRLRMPTDCPGLPVKRGAPPTLEPGLRPAGRSRTIARWLWRKMPESCR